MTTALDIITSALRKNGVLTKSETPAADEVSEALDTLNDMLESWSTDSLLVFTRVWESFALTDGDGEYTIGVGADFNTPRPNSIIEAHVRQGIIDYPLGVLSDTLYNRYITDKETQGVPEFINFDNAYPIAIMRIWPIPIGGYTLHLVTEKEQATLAITDVISLPPGWKRAMIFNLAVELAPEYGQEPSQTTQAIAVKSLGSIKNAVSKVRSLDAQPLTGDIFDIYTGWQS